MTTTQQARPRRRLDIASVLLALIGVLSGVVAYWLISTRGTNPLILVPAVVAVTIGLSHMFRYEVPRR